MAPTVAAVAVQPTLTQSGARLALQAAEQYALEIGVPMSIAVVDAHTHLLSFTRMDGAKITSINTAMDMAFTAASNRIPTSAYGENPWPGSATSGIGNSISGRYCTLGGGIPILSPTGNGDILGAIGCSTGTSAQDEAAAKAGRDAVLALILAEKDEDERRLEQERRAVLNLWKEKEEEVGALREELERGHKRLRLDDYPVARRGSICLSVSGSLSGRSGNNAPDTPPEEGEIQATAIQPSFIGEVAVGKA